MKISTSYFYQVRHFKPWMIPISTAVGNPKWYEHKYNVSKEYVDNNGIVNGITCHMLTPAGVEGACNPYICQRDQSKCTFIRNYKAKLDAQDFEKIYAFLQKTATRIQAERGFQEEPHIVLLVHEMPDNPCSERVPLQQYFKEHGIDCEDLTYPIK